MCSWVVCKPDVMVSISICHETNYQLFTFKHPMAFTGLWLYILDYFLYTHTHTCTCTRTHIPMHTHSQAYVHTHTVHMIGRQKGMIHLRVLFWLANLLLLRMGLTVAQSCTTQSCSGFRIESKYPIDLYTSQTSLPVIYPLKFPLS